jgi:tetratricopeptide (TPR) repeat protein
MILNKWYSDFIKIFLPFIFVVVFRLAPLPELLHVNLQLAQYSQETQRYDQVAENLREVVSHQPWRLELWEVIGIQEIETGNWGWAIEAFQQAAYSGILSVDGQVAMGDAYFQSGDEPGALSVWQAIIDKGIISIQAYERVFNIQKKAHNYSAMLAVLHDWIKADPENAFVTSQYSLLLVLSDPLKALGYLDEAVELDPSFESNAKVLSNAIESLSSEDDQSYQHLVIGRALGKIEEWELAENAFRDAVNKNPEYAEAWAFLGEAKQQLGEGGWSELEQARELNSRSVLIQALLALYWRRNGEPERAFVALYDASRIEPDNGIWVLEMGLTRAEMGNIISAFKYIQQAVDIEPKNPLYWQILAKFCVIHNMEIQTSGLPAARQFLLLSPDDPTAFDLLGWVFMALDDNISAERFFMEALEAEPMHASTHLHLGQLYLFNDRYEDAYSHLSLASQLVSDENEISIQANRLLSRYYGISD